MIYNIHQVQSRLKDLGFYTGAVDGIAGPLTHAAIVAFKSSVGLRARPYIGPITLQKLNLSSDDEELPWINEINKVLGLHETRDNKVLTEWLRSDGHLLGDPAKLPWCGDAVETSMRRGLPEEVFPDLLEQNPYWARNWGEFGFHCGICYGAVGVFERPGGGGHVAYIIGVNRDGTKYRIRGGNQRNSLNDDWIDAGRLLDSRWPASYPKEKQRPAPILSDVGAVLSRNEA